jgi:aspartyl-tRNA(Asn)/glutamyl-tRNA(Gln) amidotransferase subunit B
MSTVYETVIGLEVHLQFKTHTKIFCSCVNEYGNLPNTNTCPVCLGLPGTLPVLNKNVLLSAIKVALALNCDINRHTKFDRKNYYYPDLPKGYQISQYDLPIGQNGVLKITSDAKPKTIRIRRAHLEEDAGKLIHDPSLKCSLVDYNRTGTPLLEIVTEPDLASPQEAYDYLTALKLLLQYLHVSDCDMEKGSLRCDANISLRPQSAAQLGTKTELKNMNSFKAVKAALTFEENRQRALLINGQKIIQETRLWDDAKLATFAMRSKEEAHDYRYFPEPDLVPFTVSEEVLQDVQSQIPELPTAKFDRMLERYQLSEYDTQILIQDPTTAEFFENCYALYPQAKKICNWMSGALLQELNARKTAIPETPLLARTFVDLIAQVESGKVSNLRGKDILKIMIDSGAAPDKIIEEQGWAQVSDDAALDKLVEQTLSDNPNVVQQIQQGKQNALGFLVGQVMRQTEGKANPKKVSELIRRRLFHE